MFRCVLLFMALLVLGGCTFHSTAKDWNGLMGSDGEPAYYKTTTKVAFNLLVVVPFFGDVSIDGLVEELTGDINNENGNLVRIVQGSSENYWYGFPPFTWIITPVVSTVSAEYSPNKQVYDKDQKKIVKDKSSDSGINPIKW